MKTSNIVVKSALALTLALPMLAMADSQLTIGSGTAAAHLDFKIVIPRILFLGVGSGYNTLATSTTVDKVTFDYTNNPADVGTGTAATTTSGTAVNVRVVGNNGQIGLTAATVGALSNGATPADSIPWTQITATSNLSSLPSPVIPLSGTGSSSNVTISNGTKITDRTAIWTFSYANSAVVAPGTYGDTVANNARVTYTATMP